MKSDKFMFKEALKKRTNTRQGILSLTSSVYDPLGFVTPIILSAKKLLQDLCKQNLGWDDSISDVDSERWEKWKSQLPSLSEITVNRCVKPPCFGDLKLAELHNFADASQIAYGAVSYLRLVDRIHCTFLAGKCRLAHLRPMTVPRLELQIEERSSQLLRNLGSCENKAGNKFKLERDSNPRPLQCRCSALPTELSSQLGAGHIVSS